MKALTLALFLISSTICSAQDSMEKVVNSFFRQYARDKNIVTSSKELLRNDTNIVIERISRFTTDTSIDKRYATFRLAEYLSKSQKGERTKTKAIDILVQGLKDKDGGIVYYSQKALTTLNKSDFSLEQKYTIRQKIEEGPQPHYDYLIKIGGWLEIKDLVYFFRQNIQDKKKTTGRERWAMRLALARMGEQDMVDYCLGKAENASLNDDVIYELVPDLVYTRQKKIFSFLFKIIESDEKKCSSPNPDSNENILCAYRVIEKIAPVIEQFTLKTDRTGDLICNNPDEILSVSREWIKENKEKDYQIEMEKF
jgi:hypothetical protein